MASVQKRRGCEQYTVSEGPRQVSAPDSGQSSPRVSAGLGILEGDSAKADRQQPLTSQRPVPAACHSLLVFDLEVSIE